MKHPDVKTLADIAALSTDIIIPRQAAAVLECDPYAINLLAKTPEGRAQLGFPVTLSRTRVKIPRIPFLKYMGWEEVNQG